jgi:hypothetical protein
MNPVRHTDHSAIVRSLSVIPWVYIALLSVLGAAEVATSGSRTTRLLFLTGLVLPWFIGAVLLTWSDGPLKNWTIKLIVSLSFSAILCYTAIILTQLTRFPGFSPVVSSGLIVGFPMAWNLLFLAHMSPRRCPACERRSLIPLLQLTAQEKRSANTRWCASCGGKYWKDRTGAWQKERRQTWHDRTQIPTAARPSSEGAIPAPASASKNVASQSAPSA